MPVPADFVQATWRKSSRSGNTGNCVEAAELPTGARVVRDTKDRDGGLLAVDGTAWSAFTDAIKDGRLDG